MALYVGSRWDATFIDTLIVITFLVLAAGLLASTIRYVYHYLCGLTFPPGAWECAYWPTQGQFRVALTTTGHREVGRYRISAFALCGDEKVTLDDGFGNSQNNGRTELSAQNVHLASTPTECTVIVRLVPDAWYRAFPKGKTQSGAVTLH